MAKSLHHTVSNSGGEVSPKLDARVDQAKYGTWLRQSRNMIPYRTGGLTRAVGTLQMAKTKYSYANSNTHNFCSRLVPFKFSETTSFMLEFGHLYIRFYSNEQQVVLSSAPIWVSGTNYPRGAYVEDPTDGNRIYYTATGIVGGSTTPPHLNTVDPLGGFTGWQLQSILEVPTIYGGDSGVGSIYDTDIWKISYCQINDIVYLTCPSVYPAQLTRLSDTNWTWNISQFLTPPLLDQNVTDTVLTPSALSGSITVTASAPAWKPGTSYTLFNSVEVAGSIYNCVVPHVSDSSAFATDLALGYWQRTVIFNSGDLRPWQLATLRNAQYLEVDGTAAAGFTDGTSNTISCIGSYTVRTYGVWSSDISIQQSTDQGSTWTTIFTLTSRSDANRTEIGKAQVASLFRIVITNSIALISPGMTNPRVVFECNSAFQYGVVNIERISDYFAVGFVVTQLGDSNPLQPAWDAAGIYVVSDKVSYQNANYTCSVNVGPSASPPSVDTTHWTLNAPAGTIYWSEAAWSNFRGFPQGVTAFQQRLIFGGSVYEPQRIWGSVTNDLENFDRTNPVDANNGFAFDLNAPGRGPIQWLIAQGDLFVGFNGAEWVVNSGQTSSNQTVSGAAITATAINAVEQGSFGSEPFVQPTIVGNSAFFVQRQGDSLRQMQFSFYTNKFLSQDLCSLADHLFTSRIAQIAYQARWRHQGLVWAVTKQGTLCGLSYDLDGEIGGWCRRDTGYGQNAPDGTPITPDSGFESVSVLPGEATDDDQVWVVTSRLVGGLTTRFIEVVNPVNWEEVFFGAPNPPVPVLAEAYYVDCGAVVINPGSLTFNVPRLANLVGRYVVGLADGSAFGPIQVGASGSITLPDGIPTTVSIVVVGLPIPYAGQPMRIDMDPARGSTQGLIKTISDVFVRVWNGVGGSISNGTSTYALWVTGTTYAPGDSVISPLDQGAYQCKVATSGATDPSQDATNWAPAFLPSVQQAVPIPYTPVNQTPFAARKLVTVPTDIRVTPQNMPSPGTDPVFIVSGNDALPVTVLGITLKYDISSVP